MTGWVHSIQTMGTVDGPGVRFVVFLQGCNLRCDYCHNPDTWAHGNRTENKTSSQGGREAGTKVEGHLSSEKERAQAALAQPMDSKELASRANRYRAYYGKTPGITVSGGEALCQQEFVTDLFSECKQIGFHTALDTAGSIPATMQLLAVTDLCLLDIKYTTEADYRRFTGGSLRQTLSFLEQLETAGIKTIIRQVIVPERNDTREAVDALCTLIRGYRCVQKIELLPFRKLCIEKYEAMGIAFPLLKTEQASKESVQRLQNYCEACLSNRVYNH